MPIPHWHLVMVGPVVKIDPAMLPKRRNIHWLGQQPYELLPQLVADWDVCLMPFALNESTRFISPTKTLEYMAAGKPVISTDIPDVRSMFADVVTIAAGADAFVAACRAVLAADGPAREAHLVAMGTAVQRYSWDESAATVHRAILAAIEATPHAATGARLLPAADASLPSTAMATGSPPQDPAAVASAA